MMMPSLFCLRLLFLWVLTTTTIMMVAAQTCAPTAGTYCPSASGSPIDCPVGYYCTGLDPANDHTPCPPGTANPLGAQSSAAACGACAANTVALVQGQAACRQCPAGSVYGSASACAACLAGTYAAQGDVACGACAAGQVSAASAGACASCRPGTYAPGQGSNACTQCPAGTYTFTPPSVAGGPFAVVWGATSAAQCLANPLAPAASLICLPGTRIVGSACAACPIGYYCPQITQYPQLTGQVRACPAGASTPAQGALSAADCTISTPLLPFNLAQCAVTPGDVSLLTSLPVSAVTTSFDTSTVYFATATAVYRLFLQTNTLERLAGTEGLAGPGVAAGTSTTGALALFASITAIAVDLDAPTATVIVVGDGNALRSIDVFTRAVVVMGEPGDLSSTAGGIALRRDPSSGQRWAYASDAAAHRIIALSVDDPTQPRVLVAGDVGGVGGYADGYGASALFRAPMGLAFFERALGASRVLLVADSGNAAIRALDTVTRSVQTWFAPQDSVTPELSTPVSVAVSPQDNIVYVADTGLQRVVAIQMPSFSLNPAIKVLTPLTLDPGSTANKRYVNALPYGSVATGSGNLVGYNELLVLDGASHRIAALVQDLLANGADGGGGISGCHLPCQLPGCGALNAAALCGNGFLDPGEQCDDPEPASGCYSSNCTIRPNYACPLLASGGGAPPSSCLSPCAGHLYAPTSTYYCAQDCAGLTPPTGYTVDAQCAVTDIDECVENADNCDKINAQCINTPGPPPPTHKQTRACVFIS